MNNNKNNNDNKKKQKKRDQGDQFLSVANILLLLEADIFPFLKNIKDVYFEICKCVV